MTDRQYDLILFGASGHTGKYTAEHIANHLPTNLSWAVAGRSEPKLSAVVSSLRNLNIDRRDPAVEIAQLDSYELRNLAKKTRLLINCVGPYCVYGTPVVQACLEQRTHYLDATGESPWVKQIVQKHHACAQSSGVIIIPEIGLESAPPDLITYSISSYFRSKKSLPTKEVILTVHDIKGSASGGTLATIQQVFKQFSLREIWIASRPEATCPISLPKYPPKSMIEQLFGIRKVSELGSTLTTSFQASSDTPVVYRSWGLMTSEKLPGESYGPNFKFSQYMTVRNALVAILVHISLALIPFLLSLSPIRWMMSKTVVQPGEGSPHERTNMDRVEYRALGIPDADTPLRAYATMRFSGSMYHLTGILLAQGAATILYDDDIPAKRLGGGVLTPATLGFSYIDRLADAGVLIQTRSLN